MSSTVKRINAITGLKFQTIISNLSMMSNPLIALFLVIVFRKVMANLPQAVVRFGWMPFC
ncbi:hypothetical protein IGK51_002381 [Enterococcus sp. DIV0098]